MINSNIYNIINNNIFGDDMKLKDINTSMPLPSQKQAMVQQKKKPNGAPTSGALFKAELDKEKAK